MSDTVTEYSSGVSVQLSVNDREIVAAETREQRELELGVQKRTLQEEL
jgi:hypothetical protein